MDVISTLHRKALVLEDFRTRLTDLNGKSRLHTAIVLYGV